MDGPGGLIKTIKYFFRPPNIDPSNNPRDDDASDKKYDGDEEDLMLPHQAASSQDFGVYLVTGFGGRGGTC